MFAIWSLCFSSRLANLAIWNQGDLYQWCWPRHVCQDGARGSWTAAWGITGHRGDYRRW